MPGVVAGCRLRHRVLAMAQTARLTGIVHPSPHLEGAISESRNEVGICQTKWTCQRFSRMQRFELTMALLPCNAAGR